MKKKNLKDTQIFTPQKVTNQMLDLLDINCFASEETFFFEPSCGDGQMLVVILDKIYERLLLKYNDPKQALADTLFKFYAIELDEKLIPKARAKIFEWAKFKMGGVLTDLEMYLIARALQQSIENADFFKIMESNIPVSRNPKLRSVLKNLERKNKNETRKRRR